MDRDDLFIMDTEAMHLPGCIDLSCPGCFFDEYDNIQNYMPDDGYDDNGDPIPVDVWIKTRGQR